MKTLTGQSDRKRTSPTESGLREETVAAGTRKGKGTLRSRHSERILKVGMYAGRRYMHRAEIQGRISMRVVPRKSNLIPVPKFRDGIFVATISSFLKFIQKPDPETENILQSVF